MLVSYLVITVKYEQKPLHTATTSFSNCKVSRIKHKRLISSPLCMYCSVYLILVFKKNLIFTYAKTSGSISVYSRVFAMNKSHVEREISRTL